jgi:iron(III) transport system substrate-binding protein
MKRSSVLAACFIVTSVLAAGCGGGDGSGSAAAGPATVVPSGECAGVSGGSVTWYTSEDAEGAGQLGSAFEKACGIKVNVQSSPTLTLWQRFQQEEAAGIHKADVFSVANSGIADQAVKNGLVTKLPGSLLEPFQQPYSDPNGYWFASRIFISSITYNTKSISEADAPKSYADLLDPKWTGKIGLIDPSKAAGAEIYYWQMINTPGIGSDWFTQVGKLKPGIFGQSGQLSDAIVSGEYPIGLTTDDGTWGKIQKGAPLTAVVPAEGAGQSFNTNEMVKNAANPKTALAFMAFLASKDGQELSAKLTLNLSPLPDIAPYPADRPGIESIKRLTWNADKQVADSASILQTVGKALGTATQ